MTGSTAAGDPAAGDPAAGDPAAGDPAKNVKLLFLHSLLIYSKSLPLKSEISEVSSIAFFNSGLNGLILCFVTIAF